MSRYFFADSNLVDYVLYAAHQSANDREALHGYLAQRQPDLLKLGAKFTSKSSTEFDETRAVFESNGARSFPGGSAANVAVTFKLLLGAAVDVDFFSSIDGTTYSEMLRRPYRDAGIRLHEAQETSSYDRFQQGVSLIYVPDTDPPDRSIMKSPISTGRSVLSHAELPLVKDEATHLFFQMSAIDKFGRAFADRMLAVNPETSLVVGLPTKKNLSADERDLAQDLALRRASLVAANVDEFRTTFGDMPITKILSNIHEEWLRDSAFVLQQQNRFALVTDGDAVAYVLSRSGGIQEVAPPKIKAVNTLGAGDTTLAGFMAALEIGLPAKQALHIGVLLGAAKVQDMNGARLPDPLGVIQTAKDAGDEIADRYMARLAERHMQAHPGDWADRPSSTLAS